MSTLGSWSIYLGFGAALYAAAAGLYGARTKNPVWIRSAEGGIKAAALSLCVAAGALWWSLITHDFSIAYVTDYSSRELSLFYTLGAFWAGQAGSILLWAWVLSIYSFVIVRQNRAKNRDLMPYVTTVLGSVLTLFTFLMAFAGTNPFAKLAFDQIPPNGQGLNPLLQNYGQWIHPLTLYVGFVGFTVPFAFCIAALATGRLDDRWIKTVRGWTVWAWLFLGIGIIFGARWAYVELGWGGYWGWDPVENSSLMPWLIGTAFLHSVMIQEKKGMLKVWNVTLAVTTFALSLFGTFLTRTGVIQSVHAFAESDVGQYLIVGIAITVAVSGALIIYRLPDLRGKAVMESVVSREGAFLLNNLLLVGLAFTIFWGTTFPIVAEAVRKVRIGVGPPFFNTVASPLGAALVLLTGFCPLLAWRKASKKNLKRNFVPPVSGGVLAFVFLMIMSGGKHWGAALMASFSTFVFVTIASEFYRGVRARRRIKGEGAVKATGKLFTTNPRRYAGYVIHLGAVVLLLGVAVNVAYKSDARATLHLGDSTVVKNYRIALTDIDEESTPLKFASIATLKVTANSSGEELGLVRTQKAMFQNQEQPTTEVGILPTTTEDLYIILESADKATGVVSLRFIVNPGMLWIWFGAILMLIGGVATALFGRSKEMAHETARVYATADR